MANIEKRGKNSWRINIQVTTESGTREWIRETLRFDDRTPEAKQRKEAQAALKRLEVEVAQGIVRPTVKGHTVESFAQLWRDEYLIPHCKPTTRQMYLNILNKRILPALGDKDLKQLTPLMLTSWINDVRVAHKDTTRLDDKQLKNPRGKVRQELMDQRLEQAPQLLSDRTVQHHYDVLRSMLDKAVQWDFLRKNPMDQVDRPVVRKKKARYLTEQEITTLLHHLKGETRAAYRLAVLIGLACGLRLGEVCALKLSDIDWYDGTLNVSRAQSYTSETGSYIGTTKSSSSDRKMTLSPSILEILRIAAQYQQETADFLGSRWRGEGWIIHNWDGSRPHPNTISKWFTAFTTKHGFEGITYHKLRHTHATMLLANNIDAVSVAARMGHHDPTTTLRTYAHALWRRDQESAAIMQHILSHFDGDAVPAPPVFHDAINAKDKGDKT